MDTARSRSLEEIDAVLQQCVAYANTAHALPIGSMAARHYRRLAESKRREAYWLSRKLTQAAEGCGPSSPSTPHKESGI